MPVRAVRPVRRVRTAGGPTHSDRLRGSARTLVSLAATVTLAVTGAAQPTTASADARTGAAGLREVMFVGNNWDGTADVITSSGDLARIGRCKDLSDSVRPVAFTPEESTPYFQVSFFNGFLEYDVATDRITRVKTLPKNPATSEDRTTWVNDSRHHGLSMSPDGSKLCVAGTMDDCATVVDRASLREGPRCRSRSRTGRR